MFMYLLRPKNRHIDTGPTGKQKMTCSLIQIYISYRARDLQRLEQSRRFQKLRTSPEYQCKPQGKSKRVLVVNRSRNPSRAQT
eukprot:SAG11_NODE_1723_length_4373_cov_8.121666_5_plen_83_part_00